jgi:hypothetical protein
MSSLHIRRLIATAALLTLVIGPACADNCGKSREYLLGGLGGDLVLPPQAYENLFNICIATSTIANVRDAYILRDGGIAVVPKQDSVAATAATLSQFCDRNPKATLRFLTRKEMRSRASCECLRHHRYPVKRSREPLEFDNVHEIKTPKCSLLTAAKRMEFFTDVFERTTPARHTARAQFQDRL